MVPVKEEKKTSTWILSSPSLVFSGEDLRFLIPPTILLVLFSTLVSFSAIANFSMTGCFVSFSVLKAGERGGVSEILVRGDRKCRIVRKIMSNVKMVIMMGAL